MPNPSPSVVEDEDKHPYGHRTIKVYPVMESELRALRLYAVMAIFLVGIPFLILEVLCLIRLLKKSTTFPEAHRSITAEKDSLENHDAKA